MATRIASLYASIGADTTGLDRGLRSTKSQLQSTGRGFRDFDSSLNKSMISGLQRGSVGLQDFGRQMLDAADKTGVGTAQMYSMAQASGVFTKEQLRAGLASANVAAKSQELAKAVASGKISAVDAGRAFREYASSQMVAAGGAKKPWC